MNRVFPRSEDLNEEELDFELQIRNQPEEVFKLELTAKQRLLRVLFKSDRATDCIYRSPFNILDEVDHVKGRITNLEKALEKKVETRYESRVLHYWYRIKWSQASGEEQKAARRELIQRIEQVMSRFQFGPPKSPVISQINDIIQGNHTTGELGSEEQGAIGGQDQPKDQTSEQDTTSDTELTKDLMKKTKELMGNPGKTGNEFKFPDPLSSQTKTGTIPKTFKVPSNMPPKPTVGGTGKTDQVTSETHTGENASATEFRVTQRDWEGMKDWMAFIIATLSTNEGPHQRQRSRGNNNQSSAANDFPNECGSGGAGGRDRQRPLQQRGTGNRNHREDERDSDSASSTQHGGSHDNLYLRRHGQGRVEKWKLRFTGEPRSVPVENFIYKAKKLAEREGVPENMLLRDIHLLLEGAASDWFFTFVDELDTWDKFETSITYRFGNPNKDQGIRSRIQERKQQRGEPFIAFLTEIEKLNLMLTEPLSKRRKFEVIWDNMRQHYRSKISIVDVRDLQQLTSLCYKIDAADPQMQHQSADNHTRRPLNQVEAEESASEDSEQETPVNEIQYRKGKNTRGERNPKETPSGTRQHNQQGEKRERTTPSLNCWNCQEQGHGWRQCSKPKVIFCYGCGNLGRTIRSCERCARRQGELGATGQGNE